MSICGYRQAKRYTIALLLAVTHMLLTGCHSKSLSTEPSVEITQIPPAGHGGPDQMVLIGGRATGVKPGEQIVLYVYSRLWWVQPFVDHPNTEIQPDSSWHNSTHLGWQYAALLVEPGYHPASRLAKLPDVGNGVVAVTSAPGKPAIPTVSKIIHFSGYDWRVETGGNGRLGHADFYDPANVWTDTKGYLHLRIQEHNGLWEGGGVSLIRNLGYGSYVFVVQDTSKLGTAASLELFTAEDVRTADIPGEMDIDLHNGSLTENKNAWYIIQPFYIPENLARFTVPGGVLTHTLRWEPGRASFKTVRGSTTDPHAPMVAGHIFTSGVPISAKQTAHIDLYLHHRSNDSPPKQEEIVIERFEFFP
ncbi:MAG TPA: hypothetical protein VMA34_17880 [Terracidiphilus sp.]|nr:hypothetical protein [Terracidiphilus sp.]